MCCALVYCLVVDLTISVLVSVGLLFHDVELDVGGKAAKGFPEQQCLGAEARRGGFVKWLPCFAEEQVCVDSGVTGPSVSIQASGKRVGTAPAVYFGNTPTAKFSPGLGY